MALVCTWCRENDGTARDPVGSAWCDRCRVEEQTIQTVRARRVIQTFAAYDAGTLSESDTVVLFQYLVDSGYIRNLLPQYQSRARAMIASGMVER